MNQATAKADVMARGYAMLSMTISCSVLMIERGQTKEAIETLTELRDLMRSDHRELQQLIEAEQRKAHHE